MRAFTLVLLAALSTSPLMGDDLKIIVLRHGQAEHNVKDVYNTNPSHASYTVSHLTDLGKEQAKETAALLKKEGFNKDNICAVFVSPLPRTRETADILEAEGVISADKMIIEPLVTETKAGDLEGKPIIRPWTEEEGKKYHSETGQEMRSRIRQFLDKVRKQKCDTVLVITHNMPAQVMMKAMGIDAKPVEPGQACVLLKEKE